MSDLVISYGPRAKRLRQRTLDVLREIMRESDIDFLIVTSTARLDSDQARIMFDNLSRPGGVASQRKLYGPNGDKVIDVYAACLAKNMGRADTIAAMLAKIREIGPEKVSKHCANPDVCEVFDVSPTSIREEKRDAFVTAARADRRVRKVLTPTDGDRAFHLEVWQS